MATIYYHMCYQPHHQLNSSVSSSPILEINLQFRHFLELNYPEPAHVSLTSSNYSYRIPHHVFRSFAPFRSVIRTILSLLGVASDFVEAVTPHIFAFACNISTTGRSSGVLPMVLDIVAITPFDDRQVIDQALSGSGVRFKPASKSCIEGLKRLKLDEKGLKSNGGLVQECVICLEEFLVGDEVMVLPCEHVFHGDCGVKWLQTSRFCPLCRFEIV